MKFNIAGYTRNLLPFAVLSVAVSMLILSACGGGGSSGTSGSGGNSLAQMGGVLQGAALNLTPTVSTFAGLSSLNTNADGTGGAASFKAPLASVSDGTNLYIADSANNTIRKVVIATGVVTTLAGSSAVPAGALDGTGTGATFNGPSGITTDGVNLYIADTGNGTIREISPSGGVLKDMTSAAALVTTLVGASSFTSNAQLIGITTDNSNLFVTDNNNGEISRISPSSGTLYAITSKTAGAPVVLATFANALGGITTDTNSLYLVYDNAIRKISPQTGYTLSTITSSGTTRTSTNFAGVSGTSGTSEGGTAQFYLPQSITTDGTNLYVADTGNNKIRKIVINGATTSSITGASGVIGAAAYADGVAKNATFSAPAGITTDGKNLYVMDTANNTIRQITPDNTLTLSTMTNTTATVSTLAGVATTHNPADGTGMAARMGTPQYSTTDGTNLYVTECSTNAAVIRKMVIATGVMTTLAGSAVAGSADGTGTMATFKCPKGITTDGTNLYVVDSGNNKIRMISPSGGATLNNISAASAIVSSITGASGAAVTASFADGQAAGASFSSPTGITTDGTNLYIADKSNNKIRMISPSGGATLSNISAASAVVSSITGASGAAVTASFADGQATGASFSSPTGITTDGKNLYVADKSNNKIRMISPSGGATLSNISAASAVVSSITGVSDAFASPGVLDAQAATASFNNPNDITTDGTNLYVVDVNNQKVRMIAPMPGTTFSNISAASAVVTSITGASSVAATGYTDGAGAAATFNGPTGITTDGHSLYVTDSNNGTIRMIK